MRPVDAPSKKRSNLGPRIASFVVAGLVATASLLAGVAVMAKEAPPEADDPALESRMVRITSELRCLVCQNQTIADSNADLAKDLRRQTRELLQQGRSDGEIVDYMTARYGDFVLYRPPLRSKTYLLWFGPAAMVIVGGAILFTVLKRRSRLGDDAFEPDADVDANADVGAVDFDPAQAR